MPDRPWLRALAERLGVLSAYVDLGGTQRVTSEATREALVHAMGAAASTEAEAAHSLEAIREETRSELFEPVRVVRARKRAAPRVRVRPGAPLPPGAEWSLELRLEDGSEHRAEGRVRDGPGRASVALGLRSPLPTGYHRLRLSVGHTGAAREAEQLLIVTPARCTTPLELTGGRGVFGVVANLYTLRSRRNWGAGDLGDLRELAVWSASAGAQFVGVNPLHALRNRGWEISPYGPVSRLYRNPLYLDVEAIPELAGCEEARERIARAHSEGELARLRESAHVDYASVLALKRAVLEPLHRAFAARHAGARTERGRAYADYLQREGRILEDFATFLALEEHLASLGTESGSWRSWPHGYQDRTSEAVRAFRAQHGEAVDLHRWLQFELDRQLAAAAAAGRGAGLAVGIYQDLAIGTAASGSDPWTFPGLFVEDASVGAPPDDFSAEGQDWGLPPVNPRRLRAGCYAYWIRLLRGAFAHAGALRIDHVMGLFRQYWIPRGRSGSEGAYVSYPADDLVGILALESLRSGAAVVGEDLGTVPEGLRPALARRGVLSSRVLYFERGADGRFLPARRYPRRALVTANTHDLPPLAGWWSGRDLELRREAGHIPDDAALARAQEQRERERAALLARLARAGTLPQAAQPAGEVAPAELSRAVHAFLGRTPAALAGVALDDLAGETDPVNLPGVPLERYPSWSRRMRLELEALARDPGVARALEGIRAERGAEPQRP